MINLYNCDCQKFMADKSDNYYDLAIVDPPYGINAGSKKKYFKGAFTEYTPKKWDSNIPNKKYFQELFRISKNQIIWGGNYFVENLPISKNWIVWDKKQSENISFSMHELAFYSGSGQAKIFRGYNGGNRCVIKDKAKKYIRIHPTQKPVELYRWLLKKYAKKGDKIFDSHGGSGSILIACVDMGFDIDWCELDVDYFQAAKKRYENHISQLRLC